MDIFRFTNPTNPLEMERGVIINGLTSKTWIERYGAAGEFTLKGPVGYGIREALPIGSFISHTETQYIMVVENHEINDTPGQPTEVVITGRGFETIFEQRIVGSNRTFPTSGQSTDYVMPADWLSNQIGNLIVDHIETGWPYNPADVLPYISVSMESDTFGLGDNVDRSISQGDLYTAVTNLLASLDLGIRVYRPGAAYIPPTVNTYTVIVIHKGQDLTKSIGWSADTNEIKDVDYLWSNKSFKNVALVQGTWVQTVVTTDSSATGLNRRWMVVDASDIDQGLSSAPSGSALTSIVTQMQQRGKDTLNAQINTVLASVDIDATVSKTRYRYDFNVGDLITVNGAYSESATFRITEYAEVEDETGFTGTPTLAAIS